MDIKWHHVVKKRPSSPVDYTFALQPHDVRSTLAPLRLPLFYYFVLYSTVGAPPPPAAVKHVVFCIVLASTASVGRLCSYLKRHGRRHEPTVSALPTAPLAMRCLFPCFFVSFTACMTNVAYVSFFLFSRQKKKKGKFPLRGQQQNDSLSVHLVLVSS